MTGRGRPPLLSDEAILEAALGAFAASGYAAMSVRALNADLGLSHETISKRFGPKSELFRATVGYGVAQFTADFDQEITQAHPATDLELLRATLRAFMVASSRHPSLGDLLHHDSIDEPQRQVLLDETGLGQRILETVALLERLHAADIIRQTGIRDLWFLAQGAVAPLHFRALSKMFDPIDGPLDEGTLIERMVDTIMRGMQP